VAALCLVLSKLLVRVIAVLGLRRLKYYFSLKPSTLVLGC